MKPWMITRMRILSTIWYWLSICNSCTMQAFLGVWDLYPECSFMYPRGQSLREYTKLHEGYKSHTPYSTADLYHSALLFTNYVFEKKTTVATEFWCTLRYIDVPWLQRRCLVDVRFVHCGNAFQMPTHYGAITADLQMMSQIIVVVSVPPHVVVAHLLACWG